MSYHVYDVNGYVGDASSTGGFNDFTAWARKQGGLLAQLSNEGCVQNVRALAKELGAVKADNASAEVVRANLAKLATKAKGIFIISEGEENGRA